MKQSRAALLTALFSDEPRDHSEKHDDGDRKNGPEEPRRNRGPGRGGGARLFSAGRHFGRRHAEQLRRKKREIVPWRREIGAAVCEPQRRPAIAVQPQAIRRKENPRAADRQGTVVA